MLGAITYTPPCKLDCHHIGYNSSRCIWMFPKIMVPPNHPFNRVFHYKPSILGYPYFWKHPSVNFLYRTREFAGRLNRVSSVFPLASHRSPLAQPWCKIVLMRNRLNLNICQGMTVAGWHLPRFLRANSLYMYIPYEVIENENTLASFPA